MYGRTDNPSENSKTEDLEIVLLCNKKKYLNQIYYFNFRFKIYQYLKHL